MYYHNKRLEIVTILCFFSNFITAAGIEDAPCFQFSALAGDITGSLVTAVEEKSVIPATVAGIMSGALVGAIAGPLTINTGAISSRRLRIVLGAFGGSVAGGISGMAAHGDAAGNAIQAIAVANAQGRGALNIYAEGLAAALGALISGSIAQAVTSTAIASAVKIPGKGGLVAMSTLLVLATSGYLFTTITSNIPNRAVSRAAAVGARNATRVVLMGTIIATTGAIHAYSSGNKYIAS